MDSQSLRFQSRDLEVSRREMNIMACAWIKSAWVGYKTVSPVEMAIMAGSENNPDICLDIILIICTITSNDKLLQLLGVGPLQSLISGRGAQLYNRVGKELKSNESFARALQWCILPEELSQQLSAVHNKL